MDWRPVIGAALAASAVGMGTLDKIEKHEGTPLKAYPDVAYGWALPTICSGHTKDVKKGDVATKDQCRTWLKEDVEEAVAFLTWSLPGVVLTQGELNGYASLTFNLKREAWIKSTARKELLNPKGDRYAACLYAMRFNRADGKVYKGLSLRRYDEYNDCISYLPAPYLWELNHAKQAASPAAGNRAGGWWRSNASPQQGR